MEEPSFDELLSRETLRAAAGDTYFERGEDYFEQELVERLRVLPGVIKAKVQGAETYEVRIAAAKGGLEFDCTCPLADDGTVCKHCVAVGLAWIDSRGSSDEYARQLDDIRRHLTGLEKQALVAMIMGQVGDDDRFFQRLSLTARRDDPGDLASTFRKAIDQATKSERFVDYYSMRVFSRGLEDLIRELSSAIPSYPEECVGLAEYFLSGIEKKIHSLDDSAGYMRPIIERIEELHHAACVAARPEPKALARRLFGRSLHSEWDVFHGVVRTHADVMGREGLAEYRRLAQAEWAKIPLKEPGAKSQFSDGSFRIRSIMEALADVSGDLEEMVEIKSRDLSSPHCFLEIAQLYIGGGRHDEALDWAERGLKAFPKENDSRLRTFLAGEYHRRKRHDEAMELIWKNFGDSPELGAYQDLKEHAERVRQWPKWRAKAVGLLHERFEAAKRKNSPQPWMTPHQSRLVEILLWEKDVNGAWAEAKAGGCHPELWMKLAHLREKDHPQDAVQVYRAEIKRLLERMGSPDYAGVVRLICAVRELTSRLGREREFAAYLNEMRTVYKRKRNFMKLLERVKSVAV